MKVVAKDGKRTARVLQDGKSMILGVVVVSDGTYAENLAKSVMGCTLVDFGGVDFGRGRRVELVLAASNKLKRRGGGK